MLPTSAGEKEEESIFQAREDGKISAGSLFASFFPAL
jgi:hypothetical protein